MRKSIIGAIAGDIIGSQFEFENHLSKDFPLFSEKCDFTDDSVMTLAVARCLLCEDETQEEIADDMREIAREYPRYYGRRFWEWVFSNDYSANDSCGNGAAMRISPVGFFAKSEDEAIKLARKYTKVSHKHPEAYRASECTALLVYMALHGANKRELKRTAECYYRFRGHKKYKQYVHGKEICQVTMPAALACFFDGKNYEDVIRNCVSIGGDSDTLGAIAGGIAGAYYGVPDDVCVSTEGYLTKDLLWILRDFDWVCSKEDS